MGNSTLIPAGGRGVRFVLTLVTALASGSAAAVDISTLAGTGVPGYNGDGIQATSALLSYPFDVALDASGNAFIADAANDCIRRVDATTLVITAFAGTCGSSGNRGDGGPATEALIHSPSGVAVSSQGDVYVADTRNHCIRKIADGIITRVAGTCGAPGASGDDGPATSAFLNLPFGIALDSQDNLYIADSSNNRIRKVTATGVISTVASGFNCPIDVALSPSEIQLYVADYYNNRIAKVEGGAITIVAGTGVAGSSGDGGPATSAQLNSPSGVLMDATGALYISEWGGHRVRKVTSGTIQTLAGDGPDTLPDDLPPAASGINRPVGLAIDARDGSLLIAAEHSNRILRVRLP